MVFSNLRNGTLREAAQANKAKPPEQKVEQAQKSAVVPKKPQI
jgi:hypothetical protein